jgi:hypothetical protein
MDILRPGSQVHVLAPDRLAERVGSQLEAAAILYRTSPNPARFPP